tara:strand:+ start:1222 stop:1533 length:312 start_codon:yes stop_codon:yes gene_type:complete
MEMKRWRGRPLDLEPKLLIAKNFRQTDFEPLVGWELEAYAPTRYRMCFQAEIEGDEWKELELEEWETTSIYDDESKKVWKHVLVCEVYEDAHGTTYVDGRVWD